MNYQKMVFSAARGSTTVPETLTSLTCASRSRCFAESVCTTFFSGPFEIFPPTFNLNEHRLPPRNLPPVCFPPTWVCSFRSFNHEYSHSISHGEGCTDIDKGEYTCIWFSSLHSVCCSIMCKSCFCYPLVNIMEVLQAFQ